MNNGRVYLVGAGPGDPGLLTLRGREVLGRAEVVVYDALISPRLLDYAPPGAERIYVGKRAARHAMAQEAINALLVERGRAGRTVVRLKGGDPYVFGRGGEEALALAEAGVAFEVVPGVTAGVAGPACAGIPVTHRGLANCVGFVTGHSAGEGAGDGGGESLDWASLGAWKGTLVFYMGVSNLPAICRGLTEHGMPPITPAAVVHWGGTPRQRVVAATLAGLPAAAEAARIEPPALIVVGKVVSLRERLDWFTRRPLWGRRVAVTRPRAQSREMIALLEQAGAEVVECPTIRIEPVADAAPMNQAVGELKRFDWALFTSVNAVDAFWAAVREQGLDARALAPCRVAAIGPATARRLAQIGITPDVQPEEFTTAALVEALARSGDLAGRRVLCPRSDVAPRDLVDGLSAAGAQVTEVVAYRTVPDSDGATEARRLLEAGQLHWITFTSSSTVEYLLKAIGPAAVAKSGALLASIGPATSAALRRAGLAVAVEAGSATAEGLADAIIRFHP